MQGGKSQGTMYSLFDLMDTDEFEQAAKEFTVQHKDNIDSQLYRPSGMRIKQGKLGKVSFYRPREPAAANFPGDYIVKKENDGINRTASAEEFMMEYYLTKLYGAHGLAAKTLGANFQAESGNAPFYLTQHAGESLDTYRFGQDSKMDTKLSEGLEAFFRQAIEKISSTFSLIPFHGDHWSGNITYRMNRDENFEFSFIDLDATQMYAFAYADDDRESVVIKDAKEIAIWFQMTLALREKKPKIWQDDHLFRHILRHTDTSEFSLYAMLLRYRIAIEDPIREIIEK